MATKVMLFNPSNGLYKEGYFGFSWTYLFFGWIVPIFRSELGIAALHLIFTIFTIGIWQLIFSFLYNKQYTQRRLQEGFILRDNEYVEQKARMALGIIAPAMNTPQQTIPSLSTPPVHSETIHQSIVSPEISTDSKKNKILIAIASIILLVLLIGLISFFSSSKRKDESLGASTQTVQSEAQAKAEKLKAEIAALPAVTSRDLAHAYDENTVAADQRFKGKKFKVTGIVTDINTDLTGSPYVTLDNSDGFLEPQFELLKSENNDIAKLKKGQQLSLLCVGRGDIAKIPMSDCSILNETKIENTSSAIKQNQTVQVPLLNPAPALPEVQASITQNAIQSNSTASMTSQSHRVCNLDPNGDNFLALKEAPKASSLTLLKMTDGTILFILEKQDPWYQVKMTNGKIGWAHSKWICQTNGQATQGEAIQSTNATRASKSASFNCLNASTNIEKMICGSEELSELDAQLSVVYKNTLSIATEKESLKIYQNNWRKTIRDVCTLESCVKAAYKNRIAELK